VWAITWHDYVAGRTLAAGLPRLGEWDADEAISWLWSLMVDSVIPQDDRMARVAKLEKAMMDPFLLLDESWGTGPTAEAGMAAMMDMFPAAAAPRVPKE